MVRICQPLISHSIAALLPALLLYSYLIREVHLSNASANQNVQAFDGPPPLALSPASGGTAASTTINTTAQPGIFWISDYLIFCRQLNILFRKTIELNP